MRHGPRISLLAIAPLAALATGCGIFIPEVTTQPILHNPFPQLSRVAILPFFNQSAEPTVNGRQFAQAYFAALQETRGYEVVPVGVTENMARDLQTDLSNPESRRQLAKALGVDVLVLGSVTDFTPYYPPRCAMRVDWYAANAGFHEIPVGYGLPWGTPAEEFIPSDVVFGAEMALAREQLATQSPLVAANRVHHATPGALPIPEPVLEPTPRDVFQEEDDEAADVEALPTPPEGAAEGDALAWRPAGAARASSAGGATGVTGAGVAAVTTGAIPTAWPDARGFAPPGPSPLRPVVRPFNGPVISHTRLFRGSDGDFTAALASYYGFQDDARFGGWESYLDRSDDFIRFCCHLHLRETLVARGGGGETRVVRRWSNDR